MLLRTLNRDEVKVYIRAEPDDLPVRGNAMASGNDAFDREAEESIISRLEDGDVWAWAAVTVTVAWGVFAASDHLGACSYADEADFRQPGGYFDDMIDAALEQINSVVLEAYTKIDRELAA